MRLSALLTAIALSLGIVACGSDSGDSDSGQAATQDVPTVPENLGGEPERSAPPAESTADLESNAGDWDVLSEADQRSLAGKYLKTSGKRYSGQVKAAGLLRELSDQESKDIADDTGSIGNMLRFAAELASSGKIGEARAAHLNQGLVGKRKAEVKALIGGPDRVQNVAGQVYWNYNFKDNLWQIVFSGDTVSQVNQF